MQFCSYDDFGHNDDFSGTVTLALSGSNQSNKFKDLVSDNYVNINGGTTTAQAEDGCATFHLLYTGSTGSDRFSLTASADGHESTETRTFDASNTNNGIAEIVLFNDSNGAYVVKEGVAQGNYYGNALEMEPGTPVTMRIIRYLPGGIGASNTNWKTTSYRFNTDPNAFGTSA